MHSHRPVESIPDILKVAVELGATGQGTAVLDGTGNHGLLVIIKGSKAVRASHESLEPPSQLTCGISRSILGCSWTGSALESVDLSTGAAVFFLWRSTDWRSLNFRSGRRLSVKL
ncbi:Hypothetical protein Deide_00133 [Deinococcus deserti VCD115]|uniref:Uncharacterized protein n=1 Tax=Deinococcus deserti (strain DSM 17065 / CIP 109153 / LMG 22923 / VCD115) TaxID=546414 RepID=C1CXK3_DEIDV|nr:Hypothetical protein Deide_00133 [Deinococcus deserti VCD115]